MDGILVGGIAVSAFVAGLFFLRFWRHTADRFFLFFAISFWLEGTHRVALFALYGHDEASPLAYLPRLLAYVLIIVAIVDKNRAASLRNPRS